MAADLPTLSCLINAEGAPVVRVGSSDYTDLKSLLAAHEDLAAPENAAAAAEAVNHLTYGFDYNVILDPDGFRTDYLNRLAAEERTEWRQGATKISDFGKPDFTGLAAPVIKGAVLVFFAEDDYLGVPYRVEADLKSAGAATYDPLPMSPLDA